MFANNAHTQCDDGVVNGMNTYVSHANSKVRIENAHHA